MIGCLNDQGAETMLATGVSQACQGLNLQVRMLVRKSWSFGHVTDATEPCVLRQNLKTTPNLPGALEGYKDRFPALDGLCFRPHGGLLEMPLRYAFQERIPAFGGAVGDWGIGIQGTIGLRDYGTMGLWDSGKAKG